MSEAHQPIPAAATPIPDCPRAREDVVFRPLGEEWVLYDPVTQQLHVLNMTAALVWALCDGEHRHGAMAEHLAATLADAPGPDRLAEDVARALGSLHAEGLFQ